MKPAIFKSISVLIFMGAIFGCSKDPFEKDDSGTFKDARDNLKYEWVRIGDQIWMAENLAWDAGDNCFVYNNDEINYITMGRLYIWETALTACPSGWHLPTDLEWEELAYFISQEKGPYNKPNEGDDWENVAVHLKTTTDWLNDMYGTDDYGFSASPTGGHSYNGDFFHKGEYVYFWSATSANENNAWFRYMSYYNQYFLRDFLKKEYAFSVRCVKN
jgi:uncharacterized protein (TIGR02145 family)